MKIHSLQDAADKLASVRNELGAEYLLGNGEQSSIADIALCLLLDIGANPAAWADWSFISDASPDGKAAVGMPALQKAAIKLKAKGILLVTQRRRRGKPSELYVKAPISTWLHHQGLVVSAFFPETKPARASDMQHASGNVVPFPVRGGPSHSGH